MPGYEKTPLHGAFFRWYCAADMTADLSFTTIRILAESKVLLAATLGVLAIILWRRPRPWLIAALASASATALYVIVAWPLQRMWMGNNGDEIYMLAFVGHVLFRGLPGDYYYAGLPAFYPPLSFWVAGLLGNLVGVHHAVSALKIGVAATLALWLGGGYAVARLARRWRIVADRDAVTASPWFALALPLAAFLLLDFSDVIVKPYKSLAGLGVVLFLGLFAEAQREERWQMRQVAFFGVFGGLLFLTYYLWWVMAIPAMFILAIAACGWRRGLGRVATVGAVMFAVSAVYVVPLFVSYLGGIENWQATYFVPTDFATFLPTLIDWRLPIFLAGVAGLVIFRRVSFLRAQILVIAASYVFQFANMFLFLAGGKPLQAAQPFRWLVTPAIAAGVAYIIVWFGRERAVHWSREKRVVAVVLLVLFTLPLWPMNGWIDDPVVAARIEADLAPSGGAWLAGQLRTAVPDWASRTWLSSGIPEINGDLPLNYFIAHNPSYSHPAARFSERFAVLEGMSRADAATFPVLLAHTPITALLLYRDPATSTISFSFWEDAYPNGGTEAEIGVPSDRFAALGWKTAYDDGHWYVLLKK